MQTTANMNDLLKTLTEWSQGLSDRIQQHDAAMGAHQNHPPDTTATVVDLQTQAERALGVPKPRQPLIDVMRGASGVENMVDDVTQPHQPTTAQEVHDCAIFRTFVNPNGVWGGVGAWGEVATIGGPNRIVSNVYPTANGRGVLMRR